MCRGIAGVIGSRIVDVERARCKLKPISLAPRLATFRRKAVGTTILQIGRAGKRVVLWLDSDDAIVVEPRMAGLVLVVDPPDQEHLRLRIRLRGRGIPELLYWDRRGLGSVRLLSPRQYAVAFSPEKLGPDALRITPDLLQGRLSTSRREIKVALLDQRAIAGIGNLYASEILHRAGVHPQQRCDKLSRPQWTAICEATLDILREAIRHEGSTLSDGTYRNALNKQGGYQNHHRVYGRQSQLCPSCARSHVVRIVQAQRSTFYCPRCQAKGRSS